MMLRREGTQDKMVSLDWGPLFVLFVSMTSIDALDCKLSRVLPGLLMIAIAFIARYSVSAVRDKLNRIA
jgi:hypothetical protein